MVQVEVPTGREVREHIERWEALPEGPLRPEYAVEIWWPGVADWGGLEPAAYPVDDDTPQPGLRLVPLPAPRPEVGVGWREPVGLAEAVGGLGAGVLEGDTGRGWAGVAWMLEQVEAAPAGLNEALLAHELRVPASWAPGRERVELTPDVKGRTLGGSPIILTWSQFRAVHPRVELEAGTQIDATVIDGIAYVWVDPIEDEVPETELCMNAGPRVGGEGTRCYRPKGHDDYHQAHSSWMTVGGLLPTWCDAGSHDTSPYPDLARSGYLREVASEGESSGSTPTLPDPPEGWVVCRDREVVEAASVAGRCRFLARLTDGDVWGHAWGPSIFDNNLADGRYAVPVDMVAEPEPWVPQKGERVLMEAVIEDDGVGSHAGPDPLVHFIGSHNGTTATRIPVSALRPFPEDGEA